MVEIAGVQNCCVAAVLYDFGGSQNRGSSVTGMSRKDVTKQIAQKLNGFVQYGNGLGRQAVVTAFTTTEQEQANAILEEIGFSKSDPYSKTKHPESDLLVWQMAAPAAKTWAENYLRANQPPAPVRQARAVPVQVIQWDEDFEEEDM